MNTVLDTDVISQISKRHGHAKTIDWIGGQPEDSLYISVVTLIEIRLGINLLAAGKKRQELDRWFTQDLPYRMNGRILNIDANVADLAGGILARSRREGWEMKSLDAIIGASALAYDMQLATLNRKHFAKLGVSLVDL